MNHKYAYITGGASGLGRAIAERLSKKGVAVFIADRDIVGAEKVAKDLGGHCHIIDVANWESQATAFQEAVIKFGRIDYVFPIAGIGERKWMPSLADSLVKGTDNFQKPDLTVVDVNITGLIYTVSLAVQQFRRQDKGSNGFRGKIICAGSVCGIYCCSSMPIYTASKHAVTGLVRSYGKSLSREHITLNSVNPNVMRTNLSTDAFYDMLDVENLLTPIPGVLETCEQLLGSNPESGSCFEIGPNYYNGQGAVRPPFPDIIDTSQGKIFEMLEARGAARE